jgi:hypothetical protein
LSSWTQLAPSKPEFFQFLLHPYHPHTSKFRPSSKMSWPSCKKHSRKFWAYPNIPSSSSLWL